ncbi:dihydrofolate reductase [Aurantimonas sp. Leaf443]|uniref:dihydrofolate reductase n=1 Tax=Aurantimonas sp. Leaf443 TaxID=1736378 RepID=UPI0006FE6074|nr:dihydrofolate reductase [Aurantimonas sp. Leaf443]KQT86078.1 diacylglycerol kinase [Aurantimonas sp. Leaf443]
MSALPLTAVVAFARNGVIGRDGGMPWSIPSDLKFYRQRTMGRPMIMGATTLRSIGRVLDGRDTIVLTRSGRSPIEGADVAASRDEALALAGRRAAERGADEIVIAGGAEIYRLFWPLLTAIAATVVEAEPDGDTFFPAIGPDEWTLEEERALPRGPRDSAATSFRLYGRRA